MAGTMAERLVQTLIDAGIRRVYGIVVEEAAAFAAAADAELNGQLVVCAGT